MDYSRGIKTKLKNLGLEAQEKAMADLCALGWKPQDAFIICYGSNPAYSDEYLRGKIKEIIGGLNYASYLEKIEKKLSRKTSEEEGAGVVKMLDKEQVATEMLESAFALPKNDPKRVDILMKYADLQRMKQEEMEKEDTTIHYYLPLTCSECALYIAESKRQAEIRKMQANKEAEGG